MDKQVITWCSVPRRKRTKKWTTERPGVFGGTHTGDFDVLDGFTGLVVDLDLDRDGVTVEEELRTKSNKRVTQGPSCARFSFSLSLSLSLSLLIGRELHFA